MISTIFGIIRKNFSTSNKPENPWLHGFNFFEAGRKHYLEERIQQALDCFDKAVECGFEDAALFGLRAECLQELDWHLDSIADFTKAISMEPEDCNNYYQRAMVKKLTGDSQGCRADLEDAIRLATVNSERNKQYDLAAIDMGCVSVAAVYKREYAALVMLLDSVMQERIERTQLRGRRNASAVPPHIPSPSPLPPPANLLSYRRPRTFLSHSQGLITPPKDEGVGEEGGDEHKKEG